MDLMANKKHQLHAKKSDPFGMVSENDDQKSKVVPKWVTNWITWLPYVTGFFWVWHFWVDFAKWPVQGFSEFWVIKWSKLGRSWLVALFPLRLIFFGGEYQTCVFSGYLLVPKMCVFCVLQILDKYMIWNMKCVWVDMVRWDLVQT